jgi:hypothetical protein
VAHDVVLKGTTPVYSLHVLHPVAAMIAAEEPELVGFASMEVAEMEVAAGEEVVGEEAADGEGQIVVVVYALVAAVVDENIVLEILGAAVVAEHEIVEVNVSADIAADFVQGLVRVVVH